MREAVVLAGGLGTRLRAIGSDLPKPLLPLGPQPLVAYLLRRLGAFGVQRGLLAVAHQADRFPPALGDGRALGLDLTYVREPRRLGTGGALRLAADSLGDHVGTVVVANGDLLSGHDLRRQEELLAAASDADAVLHVREVPDVSAFGHVVLDGERVASFVEKPAAGGAGLVNAGTYVLRRAVLDAIPAGVETSLERDVLPDLVRQGRVVAYREDAYFRDVGTPLSFVAASADAVLGRVPGMPAGAGGEAWVHPQAQVDPAAVLTRGSAVHAGARVAAGAVLEAAVVLPGGRVEQGARLERAVVAPGAVVPAGVVLQDAVHAART